MQLRLTALSGLWDGDFSTYWRTPPGYSGELREGSGGTSVTWLAESLSRVEGLPAETTRGGAPVLDKALADRVRSFQRTQGFKPDGLAGPLTLMQLNRATGAAEPRLPATVGAPRAP